MLDCGFLLGVLGRHGFPMRKGRVWSVGELCMMYPHEAVLMMVMVLSC
jgi:hypothetical protein